MAVASAKLMTPSGLRLPPGPPKAKSLIEKLRMLNRFNTDMMGVLGEFRITYGDFYVLHLEGLLSVRWVRQRTFKPCRVNRWINLC